MVDAARMRVVRVLLGNCFLLVVPILVLNLAATDRLPAAMYGRDAFWRQIPPVIAYGENLLRFVVIALPAFMALRWRPVGVAVYAAGLVLYIAGWVALIAWPGSVWSTSAAGLLAPAYTPIVWIVGIGLISRPRLGSLSLPGWLYPAVGALFTAFHLTHAAIVYHRAYS
jgi:hypothetical protein